jgi:hypothetical protein
VLVKLAEVALILWNAVLLQVGCTGTINLKFQQQPPELKKNLKLSILERLLSVFSGVA